MSVAELNAIEMENERLQRENELLEAFFRRQSALAAHAAEGQGEEKAHEKSKKKKKGKATTLSIDQKVDIAQNELDAVAAEVADTKRSSERLIDTLRAVLESADTRIAELKKDAYEFKRDIVVGAENFRTGKTMAEKVIRYMEEKLRQGDAVVEKLRLKNATLKGQAQKIEAQLRQKEEMGDVLHYIDFHQLQIENRQYVARIEERNDELLKLKMTTGNTVQSLNSLKRRLQSLIDESEWLRSEMKSRADLCEKLAREGGRVGAEVAKAGKFNHGLRTAKEASQGMPQVLDYVQQKAEAYELQTAVGNWERKVEIAEMAHKRLRADVRSATFQGTA
jgi:hypothetical protein